MGTASGVDVFGVAKCLPRYGVVGRGTGATGGSVNFRLGVVLPRYRVSGPRLGEEPAAGPRLGEEPAAGKLWTAACAVPCASTQSSCSAYSQHLLGGHDRQWGSSSSLLSSVSVVVAGPAKAGAYTRRRVAGAL